MNIGEKIKKRRRELDISQEKLAELVDVHENTIRKWEQGTRSPDAQKLNLLAEALGTTVGKLMGEGEPEASDEKENAKNLSIDNASENENKIGMAYWGGIIDNAQKVARSGDSQTLSLVAALLRSALDAITGAGVNLAPQVVGVNGSHNKVRDIVNVATA